MWIKVIIFVALSALAWHLISSWWEEGRYNRFLKSKTFSSLVPELEQIEKEQEQLLIEKSELEDFLYTMDLGFGCTIQSRSVVQAASEDRPKYIYKYFLKPEGREYDYWEKQLRIYLKRVNELDLTTYKLVELSNTAHKTFSANTNLNVDKLLCMCNLQPLTGFVGAKNLPSYRFYYESPKGRNRIDNDYKLTSWLAEDLLEWIEASNQSFLTSDNERQKLTNALRAKIFARDGYKCCYCGASVLANSALELHCDHIFPVAKGGKTIESNLQTLCQSCNLNKKASFRDIDETQFKRLNGGKSPVEVFGFQIN